jgi:hypothetical protein
MNFEPGNIYFNKVYVMQSLRIDDRLTGQELFDDIIRWRTSDSMVAELLNIQSKIDLFIQLDNIAQSIGAGLFPLIHFETHGFKEGIQLGNGEDVTWQELIPSIRHINTRTKNNLFISMASCQGGNIQFCVKVTEPSPFRGFIGPMQDVGDLDVLNSYSSFFNVLLMENDVEKAIIALNANSGLTQYHHMNAEAFFDAAWTYQKKVAQSNPNHENELVEYILTEQLNRRPDILSFYKTKDRLIESVRLFIRQDESKAIAVLKKQFCHIPLTEFELSVLKHNVPQ